MSGNTVDFLEGNYKADNGKDYYNLALDTANGNKILIKNSGCSAAASDMALAHWGLEYSCITDSRIKIISLGTDPELISEKIPKKYHKMVFNTCNL